jgi:hypothetical protein
MKRARHTLEPSLVLLNQCDTPQSHIPQEIWSAVMTPILDEWWHLMASLHYEGDTGFSTVWNQWTQMLTLACVSKGWSKAVRQACQRVKYMRMDVLEALGSKGSPQRLLQLFPSIQYLECGPTFAHSTLYYNHRWYVSHLNTLRGLRFVLGACVADGRVILELDWNTQLRSLLLCDAQSVALSHVEDICGSLTELQIERRSHLYERDVLEQFTALKSLSLVNIPLRDHTSVSLPNQLERLDLRCPAFMRPPSANLDALGEGFANQPWLMASLHRLTRLTDLTLGASGPYQTEEDLWPLIREKLPLVTRLTVLNHFRPGPFPSLESSLD